MTLVIQDEIENKLPAEQAECESTLERLVESFLHSSSIQKTKQELLMADDSELSITGKSREEQARMLCRLRILHAALNEQEGYNRTCLRQLESLWPELQDELDELRSKQMVEARGVTQSSSDQELRTKYALIVTMSLYEIDILKKNSALKTYNSCTYGWQETRVVKNDFFSWSMQKIIPRIPPDVIGQKTWEICTDPVQWAQTYSPDTQMQCCQVQRVSATQMLMFQECLGMMGNRQQRAKTLSLVSRLTTSKGVHMTIIRGIPNDRIFAGGHSVSPSSGRSDSLDEVWNDLFCWCVLYDSDFNLGCLETWLIGILSRSLYGFVGWRASAQRRVRRRAHSAGSRAYVRRCETAPASSCGRTKSARSCATGRKRCCATAAPHKRLTGFAAQVIDSGLCMNKYRIRSHLLNNQHNTKCCCYYYELPGALLIVTQHGAAHGLEASKSAQQSTERGC